MIKVEANGKIISEFVGLSSKSYSIKIENDTEMEKFKGKTRTVLNNLSIKDYQTYLFQKKLFYRICLMFRSKLHKICTIKQTKEVLNYNDDKRYITQDDIKTLAWGHKDVLDVDDETEF